MSQSGRRSIPRERSEHNLFTGPPTFLVRGGERPIDLSDPASPPVHPPIPNCWWLKHGIEPGFADSPQRDADRDGFSNLEEYEGRTDPVSFESHPSLLGKLRVAELEQKALAVTYSTHTCRGAPVATDTFGFRCSDPSSRSNGQNGIPAGEGPASTFFARLPGLLRFELKAVRLDPVRNERTNIVRDHYIATFIDRLPTKDGREYEVQKGGGALVVRDYTATFLLDAIGQSSHRFRVEENAVFALPFDADAAEKPYRFQEVRSRAGRQEVVIVNAGSGESLVLESPVAKARVP
jgi:hypothetical protein